MLLIMGVIHIDKKKRTQGMHVYIKYSFIFLKDKSKTKFMVVLNSNFCSIVLKSVTVYCWFVSYFLAHFVIPSIEYAAHQ